MPSTSRATSAIMANAFLLLTMASWAASQYTKVYVGCYSSSQPLKSLGTWTYQSSDYCQQQCEGTNQPVLGLSDGDLCLCGSELPAANTKVSDSNCNTPCQGWPKESCGGSTKFFTVWLTGEESSVPSLGGGGQGGGSSFSASSSGTTSTTSSTTSTTASVVTNTSPGKTVVVTRPAEATSSAATPTNSSKSGSSNTAGIAAGVVIGVLAVVSIIAGVFFYLRHRRRKAADEEYARTNQVGDFIRGGERKPPTSGYSNMSDSRLDPGANKRNSVGSLVDNQDYSRRILRVANPDGT